MERFWNKVDRSAGTDACWPWLSSRNQKGYGLFTWNGRRWRAHRLALVLSGNLPVFGDLACHSCDNPRCCNPAHLRWDTPQANTADMLRRGRHRHGNGNPKLTRAQVEEIRARCANGESQRAIAAAFGVSQPTVSYAARGVTWR